MSASVTGFGVATRVIKGATSVHNQMFDGLMRCKMSFFDANPSGRILNRFSRDMDERTSSICYKRVRSVMLVITDISW